MFRILYGGKKGTFKETKTQTNEIRQRENTLVYLGSGNLINAVRLPEGDDVNEWLAANTVDFFNEISLIWGIVYDTLGSIELPVGEGFPPGFEYRWADGKKVTTPICCHGVQYVEFALDWAEILINDSEIFPHELCISFKRNFVPILKQIYTRLFRTFAIIYSHHFSVLEDIGAAAHLNTSFKHFLFFIWEYNLVKDEEFSAVQDLVDTIKIGYWDCLEGK